MRIVVNGETEELAGPIHILGYLNIKGIESAMVVVEKNLEIIDRDLYGSTTIEDGDRIEILKFVGGG